LSCSSDIRCSCLYFMYSPI